MCARPLAPTRLPSLPHACLCARPLCLPARLLPPVTVLEPLPASVCARAEFVDLFYDKFLLRILDIFVLDKAMNPK